MVQAGSACAETMQGNGDCVLLDFNTCFFALSDSSDRNPAASRDLVVRFDLVFRSITEPNFGLDLPLSRMGYYKEEIARQAESLLSTIPPTSSCTLTALKFVRTPDGWKGLLLHTGDSTIYRYGPQEAELTMLSQNNFWLAGRTRRLYQIDWVEIKPDTLLIMTTDGIANQTLNAWFKQHPHNRELFQTGEVQNIPQALLKANKTKGLKNDDAAIIALTPGNLKPGEACVVMGGTTSSQERAYRERCRSLQYRDQDLPVFF